MYSPAVAKSKTRKGVRMLEEEEVSRDESNMHVEQSTEQSSLLNTSRASQLRDNKPKSNAVGIFLITLWFILLFGVISYVYYDLHNTVVQQTMLYGELSDHFNEYKAQTDALIDILQSDQSCTEKTMKDMNKEMERTFRSYDKRIFVLENMTSNADVIDELHMTEYSIQQSMLDTRTHVNKDIMKVQKNVTKQLADSKNYVNDKIHYVDKSLRKSEERVNAMIAETYDNVSSAVRMADSHIRVMETNVTARIGAMSENVNLAMLSVSDLVDAAKRDIYQEVQDVHDSMDQYIIFTNHQFAAENNFVKYQLAGTQTMWL
jgi:hypothetical protein